MELAEKRGEPSCSEFSSEFRVHVIALDRIDVMYRTYIAKAYILFGSTLIYT